MSQGNINKDEVEYLRKQLELYLEPLGFECHVFKTGWYNSKVSKHFQLPFEYDTLAFIIISTPCMFERTFLPFLLKENLTTCITQDPLDQCMKNVFSKLEIVLHNINLEIIHDFELTATRKPKILMQTAGHVSGAARFYQRKDLGKDDPWEEKKKVFGLSLHPTYGGWFAFRVVAILKDTTCKELEQIEPQMNIKSKSDLINVLTLFNGNWKDGRYRDVITAKEKYSDIQQKYFQTPPAERFELIKAFTQTAPLC